MIVTRRIKWLINPRRNRRLRLIGHCGGLTLGATETMESGYRPGESLKQIRNRLRITTRDVEELSRKVAVDLSNDEFYISNAWLTQLENTSSFPAPFNFLPSACFSARTSTPSSPCSGFCSAKRPVCNPRSRSITRIWLL